jgi:hypothetical protein
MKESKHKKFQKFHIFNIEILNTEIPKFYEFIYVCNLR